MIFVTGDKHGDRAFFESGQDQQLSAGDYLLICGDFGFLFGDSPREHQFLDWLETSKPYTILFIDGNHENFDALSRLPVETWHGGHVQKLRANILHLMRGQIFTIEGSTFFTMGGGYSRDRAFRVRHQSYWEEELPSQEEYDEALRNLAAHNNSADYFLTHTIPISLIPYLLRNPDPHEEKLNCFLEHLYRTAAFKHWFAGHWHQNRQLASNFTVLYSALQKLE